MKDLTQSEKVIIGSCLRDTLTLYAILERIAVTDLQSADYRLIYTCIKQLLEEKKEVTVARVASLYTERSERSGQECLLLIMNCFDAAYDFDVEHHISDVQNGARLRRLRDLGYKLTDIRLDEDSAETIIADMKMSLATLDVATKNTVFDTNASMDNHENGMRFEDVFKRRLEEAQRGEVSMPGIPYRIPKLDEYTGGIRPGSLVLVGGRTSTGKTQFVLNLVKNWLDLKVCVGMFSMEMPLFQIDSRLIGLKSGLEVDLIERPEKDMEAHDVMRVYHASEWMRGVKLCYDQSAALTPSQLKARMYYMQKVHGIKICVVDFLTLMKSDKKSVNAHEKFSDIIHELQSIAKETGVAIVVLAQLNRENAKTGNSMPSLHQIRESGAIEESVDIAILIHRPDAQDHHNNRGEVILNLDKNRHTGKRGHIKMSFEHATGRYHQAENQKYTPPKREIDDIPYDAPFPGHSY